MQLFRKLSQELDYLEKSQIKKIAEAYITARDAHQGQKRYTGEPYITHPLAVASILAKMHMDAETIMAALLHDVIEDTSVQKNTLVKKFGQQVADLVDGVSKLTQIEFGTYAEVQAENFRKMILAMAKDIRVILVKLADRLHNMHTISVLPPEKIRRISRETLEILAPIAHRLGMHDMTTELEELGFANLYPMRYRTLKNSLRKVQKNHKQILKQINKSLNNQLSKSGITEYTLSSREKNLYSIYKKMRDRHVPFSQITDVYALRIIVDTVDTCYRVLGIAHNLYKPVPERFKDYIAIPKANGYQSLHTVLFGPFGVPMEIQIRTYEMDELANHGIASHWLYKSGDKYVNHMQTKTQKWVKNLLEMQQKTGNSLEFIENVKIDLFPDEVYVFTPKGGILELPNGATAIDFAYAVHTEIGNTCVATKIDRQLAPLSTVLSNGQTVVIITASNAQPNPSWLNSVVTSKARSSIRHFLKTQQQSQSIALGKQLLKKALSNLSLTLSKIPAANIKFILQESNLPNFDNLLTEIGLGNQAAALIANRLALSLKNQELTTEQLSVEKPALQIRGTEGMVVDFSKCCCPLPGDPIIGVLNAGKGINIHIDDCPHIAKLRRFPEKCITACWAEKLQGEFTAMLQVEAMNSQGALAAVSKAISQAHADINDVQLLMRDENHCTMTLSLSVNSLEHLNKVIIAINKTQPVLSVFRIRQ